VVEHSTHHLKVEGSSPFKVAGITERERKRERERERERERNGKKV
jgi:hypothetical protein